MINYELFIDSRTSVTNIFLIAVLLFCAHAQDFADAPLSTGHVDNTAINGHNTIIYHFLLVDDKAVKGVKTFSVQWRGASWHFNSDEER